MKDNFVWFNGKIVEGSEAKISALSPSANFGLNVFEGIRCYKAAGASELNILCFDAHIERLRKSCKIMRIKSDVDNEVIYGAIEALIKANKIDDDCALRVVLMVDGEGSWHSSGPTSMLITVTPRRRHNIDDLSGYTASVSSWMRIDDNMMPPRVKAGANYINSRYGFLQAQKDGYDLPVFLDRAGKVSESSGSCLFIIRDGVLITPPLSSSVLESITRSCVFELAAEANLQVLERQIDRTELYISDEVFLCGSAVEISPIVSIDQYAVGSSKPGPITQLLLKKYLEVASGLDNNYRKWIRPLSI
jgi:branched-chain amino acid aminotransferase